MRQSGQYRARPVAHEDRGGGRRPENPQVFLPLLYLAHRQDGPDGRDGKIEHHRMRAVGERGENDVVPADAPSGKLLSDGLDLAGKVTISQGEIAIHAAQGRASPNRSAAALSQPLTVGAVMPGRP